MQAISIHYHRQCSSTASTPAGGLSPTPADFLHSQSGSNHQAIQGSALRTLASQETVLESLMTRSCCCRLLFENFSLVMVSSCGRRLSRPTSPCHLVCSRRREQSQSVEIHGSHIGTAFDCDPAPLLGFRTQKRQLNVKILMGISTTRVVKELSQGLGELRPASTGRPRGVSWSWPQCTIIFIHGRDNFTTPRCHAIRGLFGKLYHKPRQAICLMWSLFLDIQKT